MNTCEICIEEECEGKRNCNCSTCKQQEICPKKLSPTIRITTKCTQSCSHCCYSCSPDKNDFMTIEIATDIKRFLNENEIKRINLMGGEFYCNDNWAEILSILISGLDSCRLVTNGDWAGLKEADEFIYEFNKYKNLNISISNDVWHKNKHVNKARDILDENGIIWNLPTDEEVEDRSIVPIGRAQFEYNWYSSFMTYCSKPERKYSFLIDEKGDIYKCPFGIWKMTDIEDPDFRGRFKFFNQTFHGQFISNCKSCQRIHHKINKDKNET